MTLCALQLACIFKLSLNIAKTKAMIICSKSFYFDEQSIAILVDKTRIELVTNIKYFGIYIDSNLKFDSHAQYITNKIFAL
jgi:hypothetical protein